MVWGGLEVVWGILGGLGCFHRPFQRCQKALSWSKGLSLLKRASGLYILLASFSRVLRVFPLGPIRRPTKLISGCSSWGIITLSFTLVIGGLKQSS